jgi:gamma-glutamyltranspeptidase / glutathione hydrolase
MESTKLTRENPPSYVPHGCTPQEKFASYIVMMPNNSSTFLSHIDNHTRLELKVNQRVAHGNRNTPLCLNLLLFVAGLLLLVGCAPRIALIPVSVAPPPAAPAPLDTAFARCQPITGTKGMVVSAHPLASQVGMEILKSGGNAMDAALATVAALNVVEPQASGLGGGGFLLYYNAPRDSFAVLDYRERAPGLLNRSVYYFKKDTLHLMQRAGATSVCTPGAPAGWQTMHALWGTKLLSDLFAPAVALADTGYIVSEKQAAMILDHLQDLLADSGMAHVFLADSLPLMPGARLKQPQLAQTLRFLSHTRLENLYRSPLADQLTKAIRARGGFVSADDLLSYQPKNRAPLRGMYHGYEIITLPPPASGGTCVLEALKLLESYDLPSMGFLSAPYIHTVASACRQALKDADTWVSDPDFTQVPVKALLSDTWINEARTRLSADSVASRITPLDSLRAFGPGNTTHLVIVDSAGNMVSLTQSINYFFGAGFMVPELGLLLNNHMGDFSSDSVGRRAIAPLHRPPSNMAATVVRRDGIPVLVIGSPGGPRIAPTLVQVLLAVLDFHMPLNEALDAPRFFPVNKTLVVETRISKPTLDVLAAKGWKIYLNGAANSYFGGVNAIQIDPVNHRLIGASDPRRDGAPAAY